MNKRYRLGKTQQVYIPKRIASRIRVLIRLIDQCENPEDTLDELCDVIQVLALKSVHVQNDKNPGV